jgi:hypothetical protein
MGHGPRYKGKHSNINICIYIIYVYYELDMLKIYVKVKKNEKGLEDDKKI